MQETQFNFWVGKIPWRRDRLSTPVSRPGESQGQGSPAGYSPWGCKELDATECTHTHTHTHTHTIYLLNCPVIRSGDLPDGDSELLLCP